MRLGSLISWGLPLVLLRHGTTRKRAEAILEKGPDPHFREPGSQEAAGSFWTTPAASRFGIGDPHVCARGKAMLFSNEGGPAILEFELEDELWKNIASTVQAWKEIHKAINWKDAIEFDFGHGLEQLLEAWPRLVKRIIECP
jgi:hypothetical protein